MELEKICKRLIIREPFWGLFLLGLNKQYTTSVDTLAVAKDGIGVKLLINRSFWDKHTDDQQLALLLHELHHLCFSHIFMSKDFDNHKKFNVACDAEVNCYIPNLPEGHISAGMFSLPEKQGAKWYYEHLPHIESIGITGDNSNGGLPDTAGSHDTWKDFEKLSEPQKQLVQTQLENQMKQAAEQTLKQNGTLPSHLKEILDELLRERPRIYDWKSALRRSLGTHIDLKLKKTYHRESKRFPGSPGLKFRKKISILVAIDTSGSVSSEELSEFFSEIAHIHRAGARVTILECDADVQNVWEFKQLRNITITGRGGTEFQPAIDYYRDHIHEYGLFVYFTDGYADVDNLVVPNNNIMWIITSNGAHYDYPGKVIRIPSKEQ